MSTLPSAPALSTSHAEESPPTTPPSLLASLFSPLSHFANSVSNKFTNKGATQQTQTQPPLAQPSPRSARIGKRGRRTNDVGNVIAYDPDQEAEQQPKRLKAAVAETNSHHRITQPPKVSHSRKAVPVRPGNQSGRRIRLHGPSIVDSSAVREDEFEGFVVQVNTRHNNKRKNDDRDDSVDIDRRETLPPTAPHIVDVSASDAVMLHPTAARVYAHSQSSSSEPSQTSHPRLSRFFSPTPSPASSKPHSQSTLNPLPLSLPVAIADADISPISQAFTPSPLSPSHLRPIVPSLRSTKRLKYSDDASSKPNTTADEALNSVNNVTSSVLTCSVSRSAMRRRELSVEAKRARRKAQRHRIRDRRQHRAQEHVADSTDLPVVDIVTVQATPSPTEPISQTTFTNSQRISFIETDEKMIPTFGDESTSVMDVVESTAQVPPQQPLHKTSLQRQFVHGNYDCLFRHNEWNDQWELHRVAPLKREYFTDRNVLDVGCGSGRLSIRIAADYLPASIVGVDIDNALIQRAYRYRMSKHIQLLDAAERQTNAQLPSASSASFPSNILFECADILSIDRQRKFDTILCLNVTKWIHMNGGDAAIQCLFDVLEAVLIGGGHLILACQPFASYARTRLLSSDMRRVYANIHLKPDEFIPQLETRGFTRVETVTFSCTAPEIAGADDGVYDLPGLTAPTWRGGNRLQRNRRGAAINRRQLAEMLGKNKQQQAHMIKQRQRIAELGGGALHRPVYILKKTNSQQQ